MALPQWHIAVTAPLATAAYVRNGSLAEAALVVFLGVVIDIDHLSKERARRLSRKDFSPVEGWVNYFHTEEFLQIVIAVSLSINSILPVIAFIVHMAMDAGNYLISPERSPLAAALSPIVPSRFRYVSELGKK